MCVVKYKFTSKTGGFESYDSHQLLCAGMVEVNSEPFRNTKQVLQQKRKENKRILPFVTQFQPSLPNLKQILTSKWDLITNQPLVKEIFEEPPLISYKKERSLQDILVRAKL